MLSNREVILCGWKITVLCVCFSLCGPHCLTHSYTSPEPEPLSNIQCEDARPGVLHGSAITRGHADLDGRHCHRGGGIHAVHGLGGVSWPRWRDISQNQMSRDVLHHFSMDFSCSRLQSKHHFSIFIYFYTYFHKDSIFEHGFMLCLKHPLVLFCASSFSCSKTKKWVLQSE